MSVGMCAHMQVPSDARGPPEIIAGYNLPDMGSAKAVSI